MHGVFKEKHLENMNEKDSGELLDCDGMDDLHLRKGNETINTALETQICICHGRRSPSLHLVKLALLTFLQRPWVLWKGTA